MELLREKVRHTPAVKFVLRFGDRVPEVPDAVIEDLRQGVAELSSETLMEGPVEGEEVEIAIGAFVGTKAAVARVLPGKQRARILLDVMGRSVAAELSLNLVLFNRKNAAQIGLKGTAAVRAARPIPEASVAQREVALGTATIIPSTGAGMLQASP